MTDSEIILQVWELIKKQIPRGFELSLIGSRAMGKNAAHADFDFLLSASTLTPELLMKIRHSLADIPTLFKIDIVSAENVSEDFLKTVNKKVKVVDGKLQA